MSKLMGDRNHYINCHKWISRNYGKANKCENENCPHNSTTYHYALRHGFVHEKNINNYIQLCVSCHKKYDWKEEYGEYIRQTHTPEIRKKIAKALTGRKLSDETKKKLSDRFSGENNPMYGISIKGDKHHFYGKSHTESAKIKMLDNKAKLTKEQVMNLKQEVLSGITQKEAALRYGISRASVCRIINNKRYKLWDTVPLSQRAD